MLGQFASEVISILGAGEKTACELLDLGVGWPGQVRWELGN